MMHEQPVEPTGDKPACHVQPFPLARRVGKIRDVAGKMLTKTTDRHAESYRDQVTSALLNQLGRLGIPECQQDEQLGAFWCAVQAEIIRLSCERRASDSL